MPLGVYGIPANARGGQTNNLGLGQIGIHASNFVDPPPGKYSLGETLNLPNWEKIIPAPDILAKYIKEKLFNADFIPQLILNLTYVLTSPIFFVSFIALMVRATVYSTDPELSAKEHDAETVRVYADAFGYFLAPFILTCTAGAIGLFITLRARHRANQELKIILQDYKTIRVSYIKSHQYISAFYTIIENMTKLSKYNDCSVYERVGPTETHRKISNIEKSLKAAFKRAELNYDIYESSLPSLHNANFSDVTNKLQYKLLSKPFKFILDKLKIEFKKHVFELHKNRYFGNVRFTEVIENFCNRIDYDEFTQKYLLNLLGDRSRQKVDIGSSMLIKKTQLYEESTLFSIKEALNLYWNRPQENPIVHPYHIDFSTLIPAILFIIWDSDPEMITIPKPVQPAATQVSHDPNIPSNQQVIHPITPMYMLICPPLPVQSGLQTSFVPIIPNNHGGSSSPFTHCPPLV